VTRPARHNRLHPRRSFNRFLPVAFVGYVSPLLQTVPFLFLLPFLSRNGRHVLDCGASCLFTIPSSVRWQYLHWEHTVGTVIGLHKSFHI
jgi:hypothetical protein